MRLFMRWNYKQLGPLLDEWNAINVNRGYYLGDATVYES